MPDRPAVHGIDLDAETRCAHWRSPLDVVAIRFACCDAYHACFDCHAALADHPPVTRPVDDPTPAVLCGVCGHQMTVAAYLDCGDRCPACRHGFNPGCRLHRHLYFDVDPVC